MPFIDDITCTIHDMASGVYDITFTLCVTSHNACISDIIHSMVMTYPLYIGSHKVLWPHNNCVTSQPLCLSSHPLYLCHHTQWINFIKSSVCMTSQPLCVWHYMQYMWHHMHSLDVTSLYVWHQVHSIWPQFQWISVITPPYWWYHSHYMYDLMSSIYVTSYPLYLWHNIH